MAHETTRPAMFFFQVLPFTDKKTATFSGVSHESVFTARRR